ncbi:MAG: autotransporter domain-containing protein [Cohaesibacter sp.]|jgi:uncharacterized protein with beta-barrel porin domain|nr:autotransporter domain-containing protein [Cohaesibacter sp.]
MNKPLRLVGKAGLLSALLLSSTFHAQAIGLRSDGTYSGGLANFYDQANSYANVANIMKFQGGSFNNTCTGTLINSRTIVTAAHCLVDENNPDTNIDVGDVDPAKAGAKTFGISFRADSNKQGKDQATATAEFQNNQDESLISGFVVNPNYGKPHSPKIDATNSYDLAIISLDKPITSIEAAQILTTLPDVGEEITLVGYGRAGAIDVDVNGIGSGRSLSLTDDKRRVAGNYLESTGPVTQELLNGLTPTGTIDPDDAPFKVGVPMLIFDVDDPNAPKDHLTGKNEPGDIVHAEEGGTAPGDSGGPMFVTRNGVRYLVGVSNSGGPREENPTGYDGGYGNVVFHASIAANLDWLERNNPLKEVSAKAGSGNWSDLASWNMVNTVTGMQTLQPNNTTTTTCNSDEKGFCKHSTYFNVTIDQATDLSLDISPTIDKLTLDNAAASLSLLQNQDLRAVNAIELRQGKVSLADNSLLGAPTINIHRQAELSGIGELEGKVNTLGTIRIKAPTLVQTSLDVTGDVTFGDGSNLKVEMNEAGKTGQLNVDGTLDVAQATLEVIPDDSLDGTTKTATIINTRFTPIQGEFKEVKSSSAFYKASAQKSLSGLIMSVDVKRDMAAAKGKTRESAVMSLLQSGLDSKNAKVQSLFKLIKNTSDDKLDETLKSLKGDIHGQGTNTLLGSLNAVSNVLGQLRQGSGVTVGSSSHNGAMSSYIRSYAAEEKEDEATKALRAFTQAPSAEMPKGFWSVWGKFLAGVGRYEGRDGAANTDTNTFGFMGGGYYTFPSDAVLGAYGGYTQTAGDQGGGNSVTVEGFVAGLNGELSLGDFALGGYVQYGHQTFDAKRSVLLGGAATTANANYSGHVFSASAEISRALELAQTFEIIPFAGIEVHHARIDGFTETGAGVANLTVAASQKTMVYSDIGVRFEKTMQVGNNEITPLFGIGWRSELTDPDNQLSANLAGQSLDIKNKGNSRHALAANLGLSVNLENGLALETRYDGRLSSSYQDHQGSIRLTLALD